MYGVMHFDRIPSTTAQEHKGITNIAILCMKSIMLKSCQNYFVEYKCLAGQIVESLGTRAYNLKTI